MINIEEIEATYREVGKIESIVTERIIEVLELICSCFDLEFDNFVYGNNESESFSLMDCWSYDTILIFAEIEGCINSPRKTIKLLDKYRSDFPKEFLNMPNDQIKEQILAELNSLNKNSNIKKERAAQTKIEKQKKKEAALAKLTADERKILGLK